MAAQISCAELGVLDCNFSTHGETPGDAIREMVDHLRASHDIDMPDADVILSGNYREDDYFSGNDQGAALIVKRLVEKYDIPPGGPDIPGPSIGRTPNQ